MGSCTVKERSTQVGAAPQLTHIPGKPPLPFMASSWRIIFFDPPPFIVLIMGGIRAVSVAI
jgi:hypothetical protein